MSIKKKIEAVGVPLKDWDIQIYRGILTGLNEAFIISTEKRDEILANCVSEEERKRTADIIRPILRGRDIEKYSYSWAGLYLICTFPSRHYNIDKYPALREYLLSFDKRVLAQTGEKDIDGVKDKNARFNYIIRRACIPITQENVKTVMLLEVLKDIDNLSDVQTNKAECLRHFIIQNKITKKMVDRVLPNYPLRTYKAIYDLELTNVFA